MTLQELAQKRGDLVAQARALLDAAEAEGRDLTSEEEVQYQRLMDEIQGLKERMARQRALDAEERALETPLGDAIKPEPESSVGEERAGGEGDERRDAFRRFLRSGTGALTRTELRALQADSDTVGGYLVAPQQFVAQLIQAVDNQVFMRQIANVLPPVTKAESLGAPSIETDVADPTWTTELDIGSEDSSLAFGKRELRPHPLAKYIKVSNKLLRASVLDVEQLVLQRLAYKFATTQECAFLLGTGDQQPLGVMVASDDGISTSRDVSTDMETTSITADGLLNVKFALKPQYRTRARWLFHTDAVKQISKLKDGDGQYIWQPGLQAGTPDRILAMPVYESQYMPNTFTTGQYVGILGDFTFYWIVDALQLEVQRLVELFAASNQTAFVGRMESDGMPVLEEAFARVKLA